MESLWSETLHLRYKDLHILQCNGEFSILLDWAAEAAACRFEGLFRLGETIRNPAGTAVQNCQPALCRCSCKYHPISPY